VVHLPGSLGTLSSDRARIRQIMLNLLSNAAKFTEDGWIILRGAREQLDRLFQEFTQVDASLTRKYGGAGLGLAISRRLCRLLGGSLDVISVPGLGSTFSARLPVTLGTV
jgi:signal transduction histidine kinase